MTDKGIFAYIYISRMDISPVVPSRSILLEFLQLCCTYRVGFANLSLTARKTCLSVSQYGSLDPETSRLPLLAPLLFTHRVPTTTTAPMLALRTVSASIRRYNFHSFPFGFFVLHCIVLYCIGSYRTEYQ